MPEIWDQIQEVDTSNPIFEQIPNSPETPGDVSTVSARGTQGVAYSDHYHRGVGSLLVDSIYLYGGVTLIGDDNITLTPDEDDGTIAITLEDPLVLAGASIGDLFVDNIHPNSVSPGPGITLWGTLIIQEELRVDVITAASESPAGDVEFLTNIILQEDGYIGIGPDDEYITFDGGGDTISVRNADLNVPDGDIIAGANIQMPFDGWIGISAGAEHIVFDGIANEIQVFGADLVIVDNQLLVDQIASSSDSPDGFVEVVDPLFTTDFHVNNVYSNTVSPGVGVNWYGELIISDGTLVLNDTVWDDINFNAGQAQRPTASAPGAVTFLDSNGDDTDIATVGFAVGEKLGFVTEYVHGCMTDGDMYFHVHFQCDDAPTGTDYVKWQVDYTITDTGEVCAPVTTQTTEVAVDTQYEQYFANFPVITGAGLVIGDQIKVKLSRIASDGDAYSGEAKLCTFGIHTERDTVGSREVRSK